MSNIEVVTLVLSLGTLFVSAAAIVAAYLSAEVAKKSAEVAKVSVEQMKQQNEISMIDRKLGIVESLSSYITALSSEGWEFKESAFWNYENGISKSDLYFPININHSFSEIRIKTHEFLSERDDLYRANSEDKDNSDSLNNIKTSHRQLRNICIETSIEIRRIMRLGLQGDE